MDYTPGDLSRFLNPSDAAEVIEDSSHLNLVLDNLPPSNSALESKKSKGKTKKKAADKKRQIKNKAQSIPSESSLSKAEQIKKNGKTQGKRKQKKNIASEASDTKPGDETENKTKKRKKFIPKEDDPRLSKTVFVGNVPVKMEPKELEKLFKRFGKIDSVRFRSVSFANPKIPRQAAFGKKDFREERDTMNAYIVFKEEESAKKALEFNGTEVEGKILRVDIERNRTVHDTRHSVFVGNLPFNALEDELRQFFSECGKVTNIRIVRDKNLNIGKGFGFATFAEHKGVISALKLNGSEFKERKLRITKALNEEKIKQMEKRKGTQQRKSNTKKEKKSNSKKEKKESSTTGKEETNQTNKKKKDTNKKDESDSKSKQFKKKKNTTNKKKDDKSWMGTIAQPPPTNQKQKKLRGPKKSVTDLNKVNKKKRKATGGKHTGGKKKSKKSK